MREANERFVESAVLELKEIVVPDIKKEIIAFANTNGGTLFIGIADNGRSVGVENVDEEMLQISNMVRDGIKPDVTMFLDYQTECIEGKNVIKITIQKGTHSPYYLVGKGIRPEGVFVRQGTSAVPASEAAIRQMIKECDGDNFEDMRSLQQTLSFDGIKREFAKRRLALGSQQMISLGLKNTDGIYTNLGLLLSDQCTHTIKAAVFSGTNKWDFQDRREFTGSLLEQMNEAYEFIDLNNRKKAVFSGLQRIDERDYPTEAVREALLNSLVHREYSFSGSMLISIFADRIEFVSLGGLVKGLTMNDIMLGVSQCRNEKLAALFYRLTLIEAYGTGIPKIMECYEAEVRKPELAISDNGFKITLPNRNFFKMVKVDNLTEAEAKIVNIANNNDSISRHEAEIALGVSGSMAGRIIKGLVDKDVLSAIGNGKNRRYISK